MKKQNLASHFSTIVMFGFLALAFSCQPKKEKSPVATPSGSTGTDSGSGTTTTQGDFGIIFVSTTTFDGGAGLAAMDAACASEATTKNFTGIFKALVSDGGNRKLGGSDWPLSPLGEYRREDLTTVIGSTDSGSELGFPLTNSITATAKYPWTGFSVDSSNGWLFTSGTCGVWTDNLPQFGNNTSVYGNTALSNYVAFTDPWSNLSEHSPFSYYPYDVNDQLPNTLCDSLHPVICVQKYTKPLPSGTKKVIFRSTTTIAGHSGVPIFDQVCSADAVTKGLSGTYKAMVSTSNNFMSAVPQRLACTTADCSGGAAENVDWVLQPNTQYVREGATVYTDYIGTTNAAGIFTFPFNATLLAGGGTFWTGLGNAWTKSIPFPNGGTCGDWDEPSFEGTLGDGGQLGNLSISNGYSGCSTPRHLLCVQQ